MSRTIASHGLTRALIGSAVLLLAFAATSRADDAFVLAQSGAHKLKVYADGGVKWCAGKLVLRMVLDPDSPDIANPAAQVDLMNRLKAPIAAECPAAASADLTVFVQDKAQGSYRAAKADGWAFKSTATAQARAPASLDTADEQAAPAAAKPAAPAAAPQQQASAPAAAAPVHSMPGDFPGSGDPPFLKRYEGSTIVFSAGRTFDQYKLVVPDQWTTAGQANSGPPKITSEVWEGKVARLLYRSPEGHTALEVFRNYENAVKESGLEVVYEFLPCEKRGRAEADLMWSSMQAAGFEYTPFVTQGGSFVFASTLGPFCYFTAKGSKDGQDIGLTVGVVEELAEDALSRTLNWAHAPKPVVLRPTEQLIMVDVVTRKAMENKMVMVKASDLADALATTGKAEIYGIQFDVDKTEIKPESAATLEQVASLLKIDRSLKLEISGHTDNTGAAEHNMKLSEGRAAAVVDELVKKYGIDAGRLSAKGYGDTQPIADNGSDAGKAKNRRVELKKI